MSNEENNDQVYHEERNRLATFHSWPYAAPVSEQLALHGFYRIDEEDGVRCHFCGIELHQWEPSDNVFAEHLKWSPQCPLVCKQPTNNVPVPLPLPVVPAGNDGFDNFPFSIIFATLNPVPRVDDGPVPPSVPPSYVTKFQRLQTFTNWPVSIKQKPINLSDAGFYYSGQGDSVICFSCGINVHRWLPQDDPWEYHAHLNPDCEYVLLEKGLSFVLQCRHLANGERNNDENEEKDNGANDENERKDEGAGVEICPVCFAQPWKVATVPCGHLFCVDCIFQLNCCPICKQLIETRHRVYCP